MTVAIEPRYRLIEKPARIHAVDSDGVEICGARQPYGHDHYVIYVSTRLTPTLHQVIALTREAAVAHVDMIARLFTERAA